jgi:hypothetical protein
MTGTAIIGINVARQFWRKEGRTRKMTSTMAMASVDRRSPNPLPARSHRSNSDCRSVEAPAELAMVFLTPSATASAFEPGV